MKDRKREKEEKKKEKKQLYEGYKNLSENEKQKLSEYRKEYHKMKKKLYNFLSFLNKSIKNRVLKSNENLLFKYKKCMSKTIGGCFLVY